MVRAWIVLVVRQTVLVVGAVLVYFGVRGLTEGSTGIADRHARWVWDAEKALGIDFEKALQRPLLDHQFLLTFANWVYIWVHWPVLVGTLIWLLITRRQMYYELRNAMFISGAIGLVIFALFPTSPPRLLGTEFVDTITSHSRSYRVLQPPGLVNKYAAMPSFHVGWNLLAALTWHRVGERRTWSLLAVLMPLAMAWATVATANHWVLDAVVGCLFALVGLGIERYRMQFVARRRARQAAGHVVVGDRSEVAVELTDGGESASRFDADVVVGGSAELTDPVGGGDRHGEHDPPGA